MQDFSGVLNGVMWAQVVLATVFIGARMYTRYFIIRSLGWDDVLMVVNLLSFIVYVLCITIGTHYGVGKKAHLVASTYDYSQATMWEAIGQGVCILGIAASKSSVAVFLLRIVLKRWHIVVLWLSIVSTTILCVITTTLLFLQCRPTAFLWDHSIKGGVCWLDFTTVGLVMGSWSATMDFVLALLPWHVVMGLNMKRKEKLTVAFGLSLGVFAGVCSIIRTVELQSLSSLDEYIYDTVPMLLWSSTEVLMTIICACIPVLRPLYVKIIYGSRGDSSGGRSYPLNEYSKKMSNGPSRHKSGGDSKIYLGPGASVLQTTVRHGYGPGSDNASEESILRESKGQNTALPNQERRGWKDGIKITDEIEITTSSVSKSPV